MPPKPNYTVDHLGRAVFTSGYEPTVQELDDAAKDAFPQSPSPYPKVIVIIVGKRDPKSARLCLRGGGKTWAGYGHNDRPPAKSVLEKAQNVFSHLHPIKVTVGIIRDKKVSSSLCIGLTIPSISSGDP